MAADPRAEAGAVFSDEAPRERQGIRRDDDDREARQARALLALGGERGPRIVCGSRLHALQNLYLLQ